MELTKKDQKHIDEQVDRLVWNIKVEASEYAELYERTFLERLRDRIDDRLYAKDEVAKQNQNT